MSGKPNAPEQSKRRDLLPKPSDYGAETKADIGFFLVGGAFGGGLDAVLNTAGFAEPLVFAGICGSGALGLKKIYDSWRDSRASEDESD